MTLPHTTYADAVHTAFAAADLAPSETAVSLTETRVALTSREVRDLAIALTWDSGVRLVWRHTWGWYLSRPDLGGKPADLGLPLMVAPDALIGPVRAALDRRSGCDMPDQPGLWVHHHTFDWQLAEWEGQL